MSTLFSFHCGEISVFLLSVLTSKPFIYRNFHIEGAFMMLSSHLSENWTNKKGC